MALSPEFWAVSGMGLSNFAMLIGVIVNQMKAKNASHEVCPFHDNRSDCIDDHSKRIRALETRVAVLEVMEA